MSAALDVVALGNALGRAEALCIRCRVRATAAPQRPAESTSA
jgi:hypothetical protein